MDVGFEQAVERLVSLAREQDLGAGDVTTALMERADQPACFRLLAKQSCVFAGRAIAPIVVRVYDTAIDIEWSGGVDDGTRVVVDGAQGSHGDVGHAPPATVLCTLTGQLDSILAVERVLLNFLQRLSGIATLTRRFVDAIEGSDAVICDTRKTTPGWRLLEKYAVRCGGGTNHRKGLFDGVLIKDNHLWGVPADRLAGTVFEMLNRLPGENERTAGGRLLVEIEADTFAQVEALLSVVGVDVILLDNFSLDKMREAVALRDELGLAGKVLLEASGGITLDTVAAVAETGVDRISVGALTHSATAVDLSLERIE